MNNDYLTPQEHKLFGSTLSKKYIIKPYTPIVVQDNKISIEECDKIRQSVGYCNLFSSSYWGKSYLNGKMSLEKLTKNGETFCDPILIELGFSFKKVKNLSSKFPYAREFPKVKLK